MEYRKIVDKTMPTKWFVIDIISNGENNLFDVVVSFGLSDSSNDKVVIQQLTSVFTGNFNDCNDVLHKKTLYMMDKHGYSLVQENEPIQIT